MILIFYNGTRLPKSIRGAGPRLSAKRNEVTAGYSFAFGWKEGLSGSRTGTGTPRVIVAEQKGGQGT